MLIACDVGDVQSMTELDNKVYVVFPNSSGIKVYDTQTLSQLRMIEVKGLRDADDIVACRVDHQLYISEEEGIWRVTLLRAVEIINCTSPRKRVSGE